MEFAIHPDIPNYAGGLGVLATDLARSAADLGIPMIGVSLIYHGSDDRKRAFDPGKFFQKLPETITIGIEDRQVKIACWKYDIEGKSGFKVPVYFLDSYLPENKPWDRDLTRELYDSNQYTRLCQEAILGIGGVRMLRALGYNDISVFHMNEGHSSMLSFERLKEENGDLDKVRAKNVFTTHTPIPAGHDRFSHELVQRVLNEMVPHRVEKLAGHEEFHTTKLALCTSRVANGVSKRHAEVCKKMFPQHDFLAITNGVHHRSWVAGPMKKVFNKYLPGWEDNPELLGEALKLPDKAVLRAHRESKKVLLDYINSSPDYLVQSTLDMEEDDYFDAETLTVTFSRRFVPYKRPLLLFETVNRLRQIGFHKLQIIYSGICHPGDSYCNGVMHELKKLQLELRGQVRLAVFPTRNLNNAALMVAGSDVWLNNPEPPMEACGTSGMKAAMNGCLNFSSPDGWWLEAIAMDKMAGWEFGCDVSGHDVFDCDAIYSGLKEVIRVYYKAPDEWIARMKHSIALGAYFNTHRNILEYKEKMWNI